MSDDQLTIEALRRWGQILLWVSVILPVLGGLAAGARYYVERSEKQLSSRVTRTAIDTAKTQAATAQNDLNEFKVRNAPRRLSSDQHASLVAASSTISSLSIIVACKMMDGESCDYASDIVDALRAGSLQIPDLVQTSLNDIPGAVAVHVPSQGTGAQANQIIAALTSGGVQARREQIAPNKIGEFRDGVFYVVVGRKAP